MKASPAFADLPLRAVFFDLDGTLVDSAPDMAAAVNELMAQYGLEPHSLEAVRGMIGHGVEKLIERAFAAHSVSLGLNDRNASHARMNEVYGRHLTRLTALRPGADRALTAARKAGMRSGVVTNKPEGFSRIVLAHFGLLNELDVVIGGDAGYLKKPAPDMLLAACQACDCSSAHAVMVGDSLADVGAARAAGMRSIIVRGGYAELAAEALGADCVVDSLDQLEPVFLRSKRVV
ncbi:MULTISPECIES: phosphoglycolate phosphatase [Mesorhizobium]|uniref:phosphoglycolate phosphatase n=1 Tax=Mesorhizobium qingshengii TaxID=1165689 RepID=A0A1G5ZVZ2_9HYPH|nr:MULTISPECIES: phosphoglycolate phosphatase [Mesorhizobium]AID34955.1 phosphoglycolate phosphatase [Mesorhizobium huakuii 7653R]MCH4560593.1 phosphoglycolate phosphatase [Mesorhizobium jarvisii]SDA98939.1 phosphoglycolate phosphatase [Mesorhizobium qingshengii]